MAKDKAKTGGAKKNHHARISYLHKAATYLNSIQMGKIQESKQELASKMGRESTANASPSRAARGLPPHLAGHLSQVARKTQIRLQPEMKHTICKRCSNILVDGQTSTKSVQNSSKGGAKPHADILVIDCHYCGTQKRFPIGARRQKKKFERLSVKQSNDKIPDDTRMTR